MIDRLAAGWEISRDPSRTPRRIEERPPVCPRTRPPFRLRDITGPTQLLPSRHITLSRPSTLVRRSCSGSRHHPRIRLSQAPTLAEKKGGVMGPYNTTLVSAIPDCFKRQPT